MNFYRRVFLEQSFYFLVLIQAVLVGFFDASYIFAQDTILKEELNRFRKSTQGELNHPCLKKESFGVKFVSLDNGDVLVEIRGDQQFIPASNQKLITTASALRYLGPDFRFPTELYTNGKIENGIINKDLYIKGFGNPKLVTEEMWLLANQLRNLPTRIVQGDIITDDSYFDDKRRIKSWKEKSRPQAYNAPLGALSFNFNTVRAMVRPAPNAGDKPIVVMDPETAYIKVSNRAKTVPRGRRNGLIVNRLEREGFDQITLTGKIRKNAPRAKYYLNITDPLIYAGTVFKEFLKRAGVEVRGNVRRGKIPDGIRRIVRHQSEPLSLIVRGLNKFSNNFTAEQLVKTLAVHKYGEPGTSFNGVKVISDYMESLGFGVDNFKIVDGSGLSHENRLSPNQIVAVLLDMYRDQSVYPEYIASLAVMGLDGSTVDRLSNIPEASRARVKTGTLEKVSALSGYLQSLDGEHIAFSILMNDLNCNISTALRIQDKIIVKALNLQRRKKVLKIDTSEEEGD